MLSQWETLSYMSTTWVFGKYFLEEDFRSGGVLFMKVLKFLRLIHYKTQKMYFKPNAIWFKL